MSEIFHLCKYVCQLVVLKEVLIGSWNMSLGSKFDNSKYSLKRLAISDLTISVKLISRYLLKTYFPLLYKIKCGTKWSQQIRFHNNCDFAFLLSYPSSVETLQLLQRHSTISKRIPITVYLYCMAYKLKNMMEFWWILDMFSLTNKGA